MARVAVAALQENGSTSEPLAVGLDPLGSGGLRRGYRKVEERDGLSLVAARADRTRLWLRFRPTAMARPAGEA